MAKKGRKKIGGDGDIIVKVGRTGSTTKEVVLNGERKVLDALKAAKVNKKDSETVQVNGQEIDDDEMDELELEDGDRVILVKNISGGTK